MNVWQFIAGKLEKEMAVQLLYVLQSEGSSPGRQGFKMAVAADGTFYGTIGGGIMEHKLVEKAKARLQQNEKQVLLMRQHHDKEHATDQSGMICSGSQLNAFIPLLASDLGIIQQLVSAQQKIIELSRAGIHTTDTQPSGLQYRSDSDWRYTELVNDQPVIHIIGGGHVALALSELMNFLGFTIKLYDDRPGLNTIAANSFVHEKHIVSYDEIAGCLGNVAGEYAVIMTIGYRTDKTVLKQLLGKPFAYLGLLGSGHKIKTLFNELKNEGVVTELLAEVYAPIGVNISSKTTREIAVSIAAEIIREKNR